MNSLHYFKKRKRKTEALNYLNEGQFNVGINIDTVLAKIYLFTNVSKDMTRAFFLKKQTIIKLCIIFTIETDAQILFDH